MYGMYVHIKSVPYATFPNKQDFLPKLIRQKYKRNCQMYIFLLYATTMFVMYLPCQLNMALDHACCKI